MALYEATVQWRRGLTEPFVDQRYSRAHEWLFDGGARVRASASLHGVRAPYADPTGVDPEEALVAALSSCHMLFFLWLAAQRGFAVAAYSDPAVGEMGKGADGREWVTRVTLRPRVVFDGDKRPTFSEVELLHHEAHENYFVANSVKTEIVVEGHAIGLR